MPSLEGEDAVNCLGNIVHDVCSQVPKTVMSYIMGCGSCEAMDDGLIKEGNV